MSADRHVVDAERLLVEVEIDGFVHHDRVACVGLPEEIGEAVFIPDELVVAEVRVGLVIGRAHV